MTGRPADRQGTPKRASGRERPNQAMAMLARVGGADLVREAARMFLATTPTRLEAARRGIRNGDRVAVESAALLVKSSAGQIGAQRLETVCETIGRLAAAGRLDDVPARLDEAYGEYAEFAALLTDQLPGLTMHQGSRRLLIVEDNPDNRLILAAMLRPHYEVIECGTGPDALTIMRRAAPDLVLLDIRLPGMEGTEVLARMKADPALAGVPAIALTAHAMAGDGEKFLAAGFDEYVSKPITDEREFLEVVARLVRTGGAAGGTARA